MTELSDASTGAAVGARSSDTPTEPALESPSLFDPRANGEAPTAYEVKFLLTEDAAREVEARVKQRLKLDPYGDPALGNAYPTTSLYTDTSDFDVFFRNASYNRDKHRVRRYGTTGPVFVERKTKAGDKVRKQRTPICVEEIEHLAASATDPSVAWKWFHAEVVQRELRPVCRVAYERVAYMGAGENGSVRLTFDRRVRGVLESDWTLEAVGAAPVLLADRVICEFKFRVAMPALFKAIIVELGLKPTPVSKYRLFVQAAGLAKPRERVDA